MRASLPALSVAVCSVLPRGKRGICDKYLLWNESYLPGSCSITILIVAHLLMDFFLLPPCTYRLQIPPTLRREGEHFVCSKPRVSPELMRNLQCQRVLILLLAASTVDSGRLVLEGVAALSSDDASYVRTHMARAGRGKQLGEQLEPTDEPVRPPCIYRSLARQSIGRYVLAASTLVGECARVYCPAPLHAIVSTVHTRVSNVFDAQRPTSHGPERQRNSQPGLSYEQFMGNDNVLDEEDHIRDSFVMPPEKYGRVSSGFLMRHAIGNIEDHGNVDGEGSSRVGYKVLKGDDAVKSAKVTTMTSSITNPPARGMASFAFKPFVGLRNIRPEVGDDLDLLSDVTDDLFPGEMPLPREHVERDQERDAARRVRTRPPAPRDSQGVKNGQDDLPNGSRVVGDTARRLHGAPTGNLISGADDDIAFVRKIKEAAAGHEKQQPKHSSHKTGRWTADKV